MSKLKGRSSYIAEDRIARIDALLIGAWCAIGGDKFDADRTNDETVMRFISMAREELEALEDGLHPGGLLNTPCGGNLHEGGDQ